MAARRVLAGGNAVAVESGAGLPRATVVDPGSTASLSTIAAQLLVAPVDWVVAHVAALARE